MTDDVVYLGDDLFDYGIMELWDIHILWQILRDASKNISVPLACKRWRECYHVSV